MSFYFTLAQSLQIVAKPNPAKYEKKKKNNKEKLGEQCDVGPSGLPVWSANKPCPLFQRRPTLSAHTLTHTSQFAFISIDDETFNFALKMARQ